MAQFVVKRSDDKFYCKLCDHNDAHGYLNKRSAVLHVQTKHDTSSTTSTSRTSSKRTASVIEEYKYFRGTVMNSFEQNQDNMYECSDAGPEENPHSGGWEACTIVQSRKGTLGSG